MLYFQPRLIKTASFLRLDPLVSIVTLIPRRIFLIDRSLMTLHLLFIPEILTFGVGDATQTLFLLVELGVGARRRAIRAISTLIFAKLKKTRHPYPSDSQNYIDKFIRKEPPLNKIRLTHPQPPSPTQSNNDGYHNSK